MARANKNKKKGSPGSRSGSHAYTAPGAPPSLLKAPAAEEAPATDGGSGGGSHKGKHATHKGRHKGR